MPRRDAELATRKNGKLYGELLGAFRRVEKGFEEQGKRADDILDYWDIYNCKLNSHNFYNGNSDIYVPIVRSAILARKTRFLNQLFPSSGRYIDATSADGSIPTQIVALLEHYIRRSKLRTQVIAALLRNGDVEGQYNLYVDWDAIERHAVWRDTRPLQIEVPGLPQPADLDGGEGEGVQDLVAELVVDEGPCCEVLHDTDVLVLPSTSASVDDALRQGGEVAIIRRWSKGTIERMIDRGEIMKGPARELLEMSTRDEIHKDADKAMIDAAGVKGRGKYFQIYEMWKCLDTDEGRRLCVSLYGGYDLLLSARRNPNWNDRCSLLSVPAEKVAGSFKGVSPIAGGVDTIQYHANQVAQQAADATTYSMLPIIMTDPAKNPRTSTMLLNLAAIWEVDPNSTRFAEFPKLWQDAIPIISADTQLIFQLMSVTPGMLPQQTGRPGAKRNQAEVALEQTVDLLTTAEACSVIEDGIMTPFLEMSVDLDAQYREHDITVAAFGEPGIAATMERVRPQQTRARYNFTWYGVEQARNAAQMQQQIAWLNVARGLEPQLAKAGYRLNPAPPLIHSAGNIFGWRMGRLVVQDMRQSMSLDPEIENNLMTMNFAPEVHPLDDDIKHIEAHMQYVQMSGDINEQGRIHIQKHQLQMQAKAAGMARQQVQPAGSPGGGGGSPVPGAQPAGPRMLRSAPGAIHPDQMPRAGATVMPRKM